MRVNSRSEQSWEPRCALSPLVAWAVLRFELSLHSWRQTACDFSPLYQKKKPQMDCRKIKREYDLLQFSHGKQCTECLHTLVKVNNRGGSSAVNTWGCSFGNTTLKAWAGGRKEKVALLSYFLGTVARNTKLRSDDSGEENAPWHLQRQQVPSFL